VWNNYFTKPGDKILAATSLVYDSECWALIEGQLQQIEADEMTFLRPVAGCRRIGKMSSGDIRHELNIVTCRLVRATKMTGSASDDWIY
jgi:hypothetical protein